MAEILIIDDEEFIRESLSERVVRLNHNARTAATLKEGLALMETELFDLVFLDVNLPDGSGLDALSSIKQSPSQPEVIIITAVGSTEGASIAIRNGAWDYVTKPFDKNEISLLVTRTIDFRKAKQKKIVHMAVDSSSIIGQSSAIKKCVSQIAQCAGTTASALILGETGTGKELFARAIHDNSSLIQGGYVVVDCAAMPEALTESVLFGHVKGAFTGADRASDGLVKQADNGTLFLDEVGELPLAMQKAFLRVLQEKKFRPVGSSGEVTSNFRLISATNRDLDQMVKEGKFRPDLLHRLKTVSIKLPPLRDRKSDIQMLVQHYANLLCKRHSQKTKALIPETLEALEAYPWPGNVRELINAVEKMIISEPDLPILYPMFLPDRIRIHFADKRLSSNSSHLKTENSDPQASDSLLSSLMSKDTLTPLKAFRDGVINRIEPLYIKALLQQTGWNLEEAVSISEVSKSRLYYLIKKYGLKK